MIKNIQQTKEFQQKITAWCSTIPPTNCFIWRVILVGKNLQNRYAAFFQPSNSHHTQPPPGFRWLRNGGILKNSQPYPVAKSEEFVGMIYPWNPPKKRSVRVQAIQPKISMIAVKTNGLKFLYVCKYVYK